MPWPHVDTKADYALFEQAFREGMGEYTQLSTSPDYPEGCVEPHFSWHPCHICRRPLGGMRTDMVLWRPDSEETVPVSVCEDCEYYAEYGRLDDLTMLNLEAAS